MVIAPCSIKTLAALASCHADTLIARAGDVTLKEGRPLLALVRETPLHVGHLRQMLAFAEMGGIVFPPVPAFYQKPRTWTTSSPTRWPGCSSAWGSPTSPCRSGRAGDALLRPARRPPGARPPQRRGTASSSSQAA